jgi:ATP-binding cassette, subfamily B, bacterial
VTAIPALSRRLARLVRPYWPHLAGILTLGLLSTPLSLLTPLPLKIAVDSVVGSQPLPAFLEAVLPAALTRSGGAVLVVAAGLVVAVALLSKLQDLSSSFSQAYVGERLVLDFRAELFRHVQRISLAYHDAKGISDSTYRIQYDASAPRYIVIDGAIPVVTAVVTLFATLYVILQLDWQLTAVAITVAPLLLMVSRAYRQAFRSRSREIKKLESSALSVLQEALAAVRVVKAFGQEDREQDRFVDRSDESMRARLRFTLAESSFSLLIGLISAAGTAAVLFIGIRHVQAGVLTLGELLLVMGYLAQLYAPLATIGRKLGSLQSHLAGAERAFALLDEAPDVLDRPHARPIARSSGAVAFRDVSFAYSTDRVILENVSFAIDPGSRVAIVGTSGAGKTSLVSLLMRFYDPSGGQILLDGIDLREYRLADLRNQFAIVLQEPLLFSSSIAENIAYARPGAGRDAISAAARAANAHDFIAELPQGYETQVGDRGMQLSGGERQRIALARAFLKDAPILILDEPTSAVDTANESAIIMGMQQLMRGRTTLLITHRPSTAARCDVTLQIEGGRLVNALPYAGSGAAHPAGRIDA